MTSQTKTVGGKLDQRGRTATTGRVHLDAGVCSVRRRRRRHLEGDLRRHGEAVRDDGLLLGRPSLPHVQLHAAAAGQQHLPVHLHRGAPGQLARCSATVAEGVSVGREESSPQVNINAMRCHAKSHSRYNLRRPDPFPDS